MQFEKSILFFELEHVNYKNCVIVGAILGIHFCLLLRIKMLKPIDTYSLYHKYFK